MDIIYLYWLTIYKNVITYQYFIRFIRHYDITYVPTCTSVLLRCYYTYIYFNYIFKYLSRFYIEKIEKNKK